MANPNNQPGILGCPPATAFATNPFPNIGLFPSVIPPKFFNFYDTVDDYPLGGNDVAKDCSLAAVLHAIQTQLAVVNQKFTPPSEAACIALFNRLRGNEEGISVSQLMKIWKRDGLFGTKIDSWHFIDPRDHDALKRAVWIYGAAVVSCELPPSVYEDDGFFLSGLRWEIFWVKGYPWTDGEPAQKKVWMPQQGGGASAGHAVTLVGFDWRGPIFVTWGTMARATWAWWDRYCYAAYVALPSRWSMIGHGRLPQYSFPTLQLLLRQL